MQIRYCSGRWIWMWRQRSRAAGHFGPEQPLCQTISVSSMCTRWINGRRFRTMWHPLLSLQWKGIVAMVQLWVACVDGFALPSVRGRADLAFLAASFRFLLGVAAYALGSVRLRHMCRARHAPCVCNGRNGHCPCSVSSPLLPVQHAAQLLKDRACPGRHCLA